ncbi:MAG: ASPIC/UnbV domain-containing protein [Candidatus Latescibacterota bacterium]
MLASSTGIEQAGSNEYQDNHMGKIFSQGFSFSGFERDKLFLSNGGEQFIDISGLSGIDSITDGRGAAYGDFDNDGDLDIFLTALQGQVHHLFRNNVGQQQNSIRVVLEGRESGRDAFGTEVRVVTSHGTQTKIKTGGSGFVSQSDPRLLFGLGADAAAQSLSVRWPSGREQRFGPVQSATAIKLIEGVTELAYLKEQRFSLPDPSGAEALFVQALRSKPGDLFPAVKLVDAQGGETDFARYRRDGQGYLVNFWATYCVPCRKEIPELEALSKPLAEVGVEVIGISLDMGDKQRKVPSFLKRMGVSYANFTTDESVFSEVFSGEEIFIPLSFLVDKNGRISKVFTGWTQEAETTLEQLINAKN